MATTTPNIGLTKPIGTEKYDLAVVNGNSDIIDTEITDAKAGSNLRIFKVKNDLTDQDNAVSRVSGDSRYIRISQSITAFIHLAYSHATDAVARFNQAGAGKIASFLQDGTEKSYIANDGNFLVNGIKAILANGIQALHATDALRISGQTLSLYKGDGSQEDILLPEGGIGYSQTWQEVSGSRAVNITYTNTTAKPIEVLVTTGGNAGHRGQVEIDGIAHQIFQQGSVAGRGSTSFIVPPYQTYRITKLDSAVAVDKWSELR